MRHLITRIHDTITTVFSNRYNGKVVTDLATRGLCALGNARLLLSRLTGRVPTPLRVVYMGHMQRAVGVAGAARVLRRHRLSMLWSRPTRRPPKRGASRKRF